LNIDFTKTVKEKELDFPGKQEFEISVKGVIPMGLRLRVSGAYCRNPFD
jgi:hypothetical protein